MYNVHVYIYVCTHLTFQNTSLDLDSPAYTFSLSRKVTWASTPLFSTILFKTSWHWKKLLAMVWITRLTSSLYNNLAVSLSTVCSVWKLTNILNCCSSSSLPSTAFFVICNLRTAVWNLVLNNIPHMYIHCTWAINMHMSCYPCTEITWTTCRPWRLYALSFK